ncbi:DNA damage checkpoint protein [Actinidia chinensis var. chinensis]|uniref:DNA damage checkpoint protein n=1 Tax=Actinidia chinensis var. chinensis TaxID=1590841 RepID=A0A2R6QFV8_ACTCC|nr:DNA damage checkpoint protein [Actinidia chinensis var. chinensis]
MAAKEAEDGDDIDEVAEQMTCITFHKREPIKRVNMVMLGEELSREKYGLLSQEQKTRSARLEKQLKSRWALEDLIDEQLNHFHAHYNRAAGPTRLKDVAQLLMPKGAPAQEMAPWPGLVTGDPPPFWTCSAPWPTRLLQSHRPYRSPWALSRPYHS